MGKKPQRMSRIQKVKNNHYTHDVIVLRISVNDLIEADNNRDFWSRAVGFYSSPPYLSLFLFPSSSFSLW